jgi:AAA family ATP:ADP antiporter
VVNSTGEFLLGKLVVAEAAKLAPGEQQRFVGAFYGQFFSWVNLIGFLLQTFFVSRIFHFAGVRGALFALPCIALGGYSLMFVWPALHLIRLAKIAENSVDYSVQTTARQALYLPTSREAKYKAKTAIDTFFMRAGDVLQAGIVWIGSKLSLTISTFAFVNVGLTLLWLAVVIALSKEHTRRVTIASSPPAGSPRSGSTASVRR